MFNVNGAAIASVISELAIAVIQLYMIKRSIVIGKLLNNCWKYIFSGLIMFIIVFTLNYYMIMNIFTLILQIIIGAVVYVVLLFILKAPVIKQAYLILNTK